MLTEPAAIFDAETTPLGLPRSEGPEINPMRRAAIPALLLVGAALGGCAGDANPVRDAALAAGVTGGEPRPAPDFVRRSRPPEVDYVPVGDRPPARRYRAKSKGEVEKAEEEMNRLSRANEARGVQARRAGGAQ